MTLEPDGQATGCQSQPRLFALTTSISSSLARGATTPSPRSQAADGLVGLCKLAI